MRTWQPLPLHTLNPTHPTALSEQARASNFKSVTHMILADKKNKPQQLPRQALVMNGHGENGSDIDIERADRFECTIR